MPHSTAISGQAIRSVAVVGGGIVAKSAAAALRRRLPWLDVTLVPAPVDPAALADTMMPTLPSIRGFHADLRLSEADAVVRTGSADRLGTRFVGWAADPPDYVHVYGDYGAAIGSVPFHLGWVRLAHAGMARPFDHHAPAAMLLRHGQAAPHTGFEAGLQIDLPRYAAMLDALLRHSGVRVASGMAKGAIRGDNGFVGAVFGDDGTRIEADLYIDAAGPRSPLRDPAAPAGEDWSAMPGCDRMLRVAGPPPAVVPRGDTVTAFAAGWLWQAATAQASDHGICYASAFCDDETAANLLAAASGITPSAPPVTIRAGTTPQPWRGNCVAIGDAATAIEPLEWTNLHLAHSAIDRIIAMLPDRTCAAVELAEYNRQAHAEAARVRDFVMLHYAACHRDEPFWRACASVPLPDSLAHTLALFRARGRLPVYPEETFARDSWLAVLLGQGELPARIDPLAMTLPLSALAPAVAPQIPSAAMPAAQSRLILS